MAYQVQNFQPNTFEESNPFLAGFQQSYGWAKDQKAKDLAQSLQESKLQLGPLADANLTGPAGQVASLQMMKQVYGEQSPEYQMAKGNFDLSQQATQSRIGYQDALSKSIPERYLTPTGKSIVEQSNVSQGFQPSGQPWPQNNPQQISGTSSPGSPNELGNVYGLLRQKNTSDVDTRKRNLFASNIEKTMKNINVDDLTQYAGFPGFMKKGEESARATFGKESESYRNYQKSLEGAQLLATQVRQFYGDSIQPAMIQRLENLTNPSFWHSNPELAKAMYKQFQNIMGQEITTYRDALKSTNIYKGEDNSTNNDISSNDLPEGKVQSTKNLNNKKYVKINDKWYEL